MGAKKKVHNLIPIPEQHKVTEQEIKKKFVLKPKNKAQVEFLETIEDCTITLAYGAAGVGKTWISLGYAIQLLKEGKINKVILVRPLLECGEKTGFLPGEKHEKIGPHMAAYTDLFGQFLNNDEILHYQKEGQLRLETLGFMRGVTFREAFVILDEAQNCTYTQLKMFLTRIGHRSKFVVCGDVTQTDLPEFLWKEGKVPYDLILDRLCDVDDSIATFEFTEADIVRHGIIQKICKAL